VEIITTMEIKVIKTEEEYNKALGLIEELMSIDPDPDSTEGEKLALIVALVKDYEARRYPTPLPDPIEAILFRMDQLGLKPQDLVPYIGNKSKVSEVLSRKRDLTVSMMRALESGLGIPAKILLQKPDEFKNQMVINYDRFPIKEMVKRGYFGNIKKSADDLNKMFSSFFSLVDAPEKAAVLFRKTQYIRSSRPMNNHALLAWSVKVANTVAKNNNYTEYINGSVDLNFMQEIVKLSINDNGPLLARESLRTKGIALVIEPHLPNTYLDGAALFMDKLPPIIGLTLRYDRLDGFWFNLMHELAHIAIHKRNGINLFFDDLSVEDKTSPIEKEADALASEALVPKDMWDKSPAKLVPSETAAYALAKQIGVHVAIVAGKMRFEKSRYKYLNSLVGNNNVRRLFTETTTENHVYA